MSENSDHHDLHDALDTMAPVPVACTCPPDWPNKAWPYVHHHYQCRIGRVDVRQPRHFAYVIERLSRCVWHSSAEVHRTPQDAQRAIVTGGQDGAYYRIIESGSRRVTGYYGRDGGSLVDLTTAPGIPVAEPPASVWLLRFNDGTLYCGPPYADRQLAQDAIDEMMENRAFREGVTLSIEGPYVKQGR